MDDTKFAPTVQDSLQNLLDSLSHQSKSERLSASEKNQTKLPKSITKRPNQVWAHQFLQCADRTRKNRSDSSTADRRTHGERSCIRTGRKRPRAKKKKEVKQRSYTHLSIPRGPIRSIDESKFLADCSFVFSSHFLFWALGLIHSTEIHRKN